MEKHEWMSDDLRKNAEDLALVSNIFGASTASLCSISVSENVWRIAFKYFRPPLCHRGQAIAVILLLFFTSKHSFHNHISYFGRNACCLVAENGNNTFVCLNFHVSAADLIGQNFTLSLPMFSYMELASNVRQTCFYPISPKLLNLKIRTVTFNIIAIREWLNKMLDYTKCPKRPL